MKIELHSRQRNLHINQHRVALEPCWVVIRRKFHGDLSLESSCDVNFQALLQGQGTIKESLTNLDFKKVISTFPFYGDSNKSVINLIFEFLLIITEIWNTNLLVILNKHEPWVVGCTMQGDLGNTWSSTCQHIISTVFAHLCAVVITVLLKFNKNCYVLLCMSKLCPNNLNSISHSSWLMACFSPPMSIILSSKMRKNFMHFSEITTHPLQMLVILFIYYFIERVMKTLILIPVSYMSANPVLKTGNSH